MADKSIDQLNEAEKIYATDLFVLQQSGTAKKLTGQVLLNWLTAAADGHGGISSLDKVGTIGLADTYRITLADTTTYDFAVTNGRGIKSWAKTGTSGLVDTYKMTLDDGSAITYTVTNGAKGDKGDNAYTWVKYASQEPTEASHSMGDIPDDWRGEYNGPLAEAPTDWKQYKWFKQKGENGDTGSPATLVNKSVTYKVSDSGTIIPSGAWGSSIPVVSHGKYLWTKTELQFNTGDPIVSYSVARMGIDGSGSVSSVSGVSPDSDGNVTLTSADVGALAVSGGDMEGAINMNGQPISGLNDPTEDTQAARKGYVDTAKTEANAYTDAAKTDAKTYTDASVRKASPRNLLDNSDFRNPVNQRGQTSYVTAGYCIDRWANMRDDVITLTDGGISFLSNKNAGGLYQFVEGKRLAGKTVTVAVKIKNNQYTGMFFGIRTSTWGQYVNKSIPVGDSLLAVTTTIPSDETGNVPISIWVDDNSAAHSFDLEWAALYEGEYTAETLPEYKPKGYGAELLECQRYYYIYRQVVQAFAKTGSDYMGQLNFQFPILMRTTPALQYDVIDGKQPENVIVNAYGIISWTGTGHFSINNISATADL